VFFSIPIRVSAPIGLDQNQNLFEQHITVLSFFVEDFVVVDDIYMQKY
jgi:hypothetical protein